MKLSFAPVACAVVVLALASHTSEVSAQETDSQAIGMGYGALSIGIDLFNLGTIAVNVPARSTNRVGGLVGLLGGATGIVIGSTKLGESGAPFAVGAVNMWVGAAAAFFGFLNITSGHAPGEFSVGDNIQGQPVMGTNAEGGTNLGLSFSF